jgi:type II secretory pathway pseudopilin PulG
VTRGGRRRESGLTLVELLVALGLLSFVLLAIAPLFIMSMKSNFSANEYTSIHVLARDRLEQLMNLPFNDPLLTPGVKANDQNPKLPDPMTGVPPASGGVLNPFTVTYQVLQYQIPAATAATVLASVAAVPANAAFTPIRVQVAGQVFQYKRIDVTVSSGTGPLGIGSRTSRISGILANPAPTNLSVVDGCAYGAAAPCP